MRTNFLAAIVGLTNCAVSRRCSALLLLFALAHSAAGQPAVNFNNRVTGVVVAPVYGVDPYAVSMLLRANATTNGGTVEYRGALLAGTTYSAQLLYGPEGTTEGNLQPLGPIVPFRTTASLKGFVTPPATTIPVPLPAGTRATFQVRAWDNGGNPSSTYAEAIGVRGAGSSALFTPTNVLQAGTPINLAGMTSFNLWVPGCNGSFYLNQHPTNLVVAAGVTTNLSVGLILCSSMPSFQWRFNGINIPEATNNPFTLYNVAHGQAGAYDVVVRAPLLFGEFQTETSRVAQVTVGPGLVNIRPFGVDLMRLTYETAPNTLIHVEAKTTPPGLTWQDLGSTSSSSNRGYFFDTFATNQSRIYRLRQD